MNEELSIVVVAGGKGSRMGSELPKQYIELKGKPILIHTLLNIKSLSPSSEVILVVPPDDLDFVCDMLARFGVNDIQLTKGGATRAESVFNGLQLATKACVAIHDAVRPFISTKLFDSLMTALSEADAVIPAISSVDSVRLKSDDGSFKVVDRNSVYLIQTPQCFRRNLLLEAYRSYFTSPVPNLTDDASIVEHYFSVSPIIVPGDDRNIKITTPKDLAIANFILESHQ